MARRKKTSSKETSGEGYIFEYKVQASFVTLLLVGGYDPCFSCGPIVEVRLQANKYNYELDDILVTVNEENSEKQHLLLCQVKKNISFSEKDKNFQKTIREAWEDFNNSDRFTKEKDALVLITNHIYRNDKSILWILDHAREIEDPQEFFYDFSTSGRASSQDIKKLDIFRKVLHKVSGQEKLDDNALHQFLRHFHLLAYDFSEIQNTATSFLFTIIAQFKSDGIEDVWNRILTFTMDKNRHAGKITLENIPQRVVDIFYERTTRNFSQILNFNLNAIPEEDIANFAMLTLIGSWDETSVADKELVSELLSVDYKGLSKKLQGYASKYNQVISVDGNIWKIKHARIIWKDVGKSLIETNVVGYFYAIRNVLVPETVSGDNEIFYLGGKYSEQLQEGIANGLALLANHVGVCVNCDKGEIIRQIEEFIQKIFYNITSEQWLQIENILPALAEANPSIFYRTIQRTLRQNPSPFREIFSERKHFITQRVFLDSLIGSIEALAWEEENLIRSCDVLCQLHNLIDQDEVRKRIINTMVHIFLPWLPQTCASSKKRQEVVANIKNNFPDVAWKILLLLLLNQRNSSTGTTKPKWINIQESTSNSETTQEEYWNEICYYSDCAVELADKNASRWGELIDRLNHFPRDSFDRILEKLQNSVEDFSDKGKLLIWQHFSRLIKKHREFSEQPWAISKDVLLQIEAIKEKYTPKGLYAYLHYFSWSWDEFIDENKSIEEQQNKLYKKQQEIISSALKGNGINEVIRISREVDVPFLVGGALSRVATFRSDQELIEILLQKEQKSDLDLLGGFILGRLRLKDWRWIETVDVSKWNNATKCQFLILLPFQLETWKFVSKILIDEKLYWECVEETYEKDTNFQYAIDKLILYNQAQKAIRCMHWMLHNEKSLNVRQCVKALKMLLSTKEIDDKERYPVIKILQFLQQDPTVKESDIISIEFKGISLFRYEKEVHPLFVEQKLGQSPDFFCEILQKYYRPSKKESKNGESDRAFNLLDMWKSIPGKQKGGDFNEQAFEKWIEDAKSKSEKMGLLDLALYRIGKVLAYAPEDSTGLWINKKVAQILNEDDHQYMRRGFMVAARSGLRWLDLTGNADKKLAQEYEKWARDVEKEKFSNLAEMLREIAFEYEKDANKIKYEIKES